MSKFSSLWCYIKNNANDKISLSFDEIKEITGFSIDHSFLTYKKELINYGFKVKKINMKAQTVDFEKIE